MTTAQTTLEDVPTNAWPVRIAIIIGSTREGRFGGTVGAWFTAIARSRDDIEVDLIDLVDVELPLRLCLEYDAATKEYLDRIDQADAYVVITPEYNHGYPASLKQAIDLPRDEWKAKPVALVSYGGTAGGLRAVEQLRPVFAELHAVTVRNTVSFHEFWKHFDDCGELRQPAGPEQAATLMLDELIWWATALRTARSVSAPKF